MTAAPTAPPDKPRKSTSTITKVFWILLAVLFIVVAGFVFTAWHTLSQASPPAETPAQASGAAVEVLSPTGASQNVPTFTPGHTASAPTILPEVPAQTPAVTAAGSVPEARSPTATVSANETPVLPTNTASPTPRPAPSDGNRPAKPQQNDLDNLF